MSLPDVVMTERQARRIVHSRAMGRCELCGAPATNFSHRISRSRGGLWLPSNGILACGSGTTRCHGFFHANPETARAGGWIIATGEHPADVPVYLRPRTLYAGWWLVDDEGCYSRVDRQDTPLLPVWAYV